MKIYERYTVLITDNAWKTIEEIHDYLYEQQATKALDRFLDVFNAIERFEQPYQFPECRFVRTKNKVYRNQVFLNRYLIKVKILKSNAYVLGVYDSRQNPNQFKSLRGIKL